MANVSFTISPAPGITNKLVAAIYKTTAPAALAKPLLVKDPPHADPYNFEFTDLVPGTYIVKIHESVDGSTLGNLRHDFWVDATVTKLEAYTILDVVVDRGQGAPKYDPVHEDTEYVNPDLEGLTYLVFKPGYGALNWGIDIQEIAGGGFEFINGQDFQNNEAYTILISNLTQTSVPETGGSSYPEDVVEVPGDTTFSASHYNKLIEVNSANQVVTITITALETIPDGTKFGISTQPGIQRYVTLQLPAGKYCVVNFLQRNQVYIGRAETIHFIKKGDFLKIVNWEGDHRRLGEYVDSSGYGGPNKVELAGGWVNKTSYPRLFNWYVNLQPVDELGTGTEDVTPDADNKTKWIIGITKFWIPDFRGLFRRTRSADNTVDLNGPRKAHSNQADDNKAHNHVTAPYNKASARASEVDGTNTTGSTDGNGATTEYRIAAMDITKWTAATIVDQGTESRPKNVAVNVYVII